MTMEQTYVTAAFFRHLTVERHARRIASMYDEGHQQLVEGTPSWLISQAGTEFLRRTLSEQGWPGQNCLFNALALTRCHQQGFLAQQ